ncbi:MATE family efflux transporter [Consotaella salsifontis]|uniref:Multidrug-efflux transporter n=1 Tax=Consotaella salsifontis TaxID=1365950 RepID=A0A1T4MRP2_9HYPH|nr:MATE family efflux transporter [Consotaella salsifontis]SJZ69623.1 multidrug resistance protein, MATE family [Consotaella salsifontis]
MNPDTRLTAGNGDRVVVPVASSLSWPGHARATAVLALPLVGAQLTQITISVTDTVMIGWLGARELAAAVLATQAFFFVFIFGSGFAQAALPLAANAEGKGDVREVRRAIRMSLWVSGIYAALVMIPLWHIEGILVALGQKPDVAALSADYMHVAQWSMFPALLIMGLRSYLTVLNRAYRVLAVVLAGALSNAVLDYALIFGEFGAPALGLVGAAIATLGTQIIMAALLFVYTARSREFERYALYQRFWRPDWAAFFEIIRLGWPIGATVIAEVGLFTASSLMVGWIGTIPLAAHGIALQISSIAFMIPLGIGNAATVRVGLAFGRGDPGELWRAGVSALLLGGTIAFGTASLFWLIPDQLVGLYLDPERENAEAVLAYAAPLLLVAAIFQIFDSLQAVASGVLRGMKDTRTPMFIAVVSYWFVGMPVAYFVAFGAGWGGLGIWSGLASGLAAAALMLTSRYVYRARRWHGEPGLAG